MASKTWPRSWTWTRLAMYWKLIDCSHGVPDLQAHDGDQAEEVEHQAGIGGAERRPAGGVGGDRCPGHEQHLLQNAAGYAVAKVAVPGLGQLHQRPQLPSQSLPGRGGPHRGVGNGHDGDSRWVMAPPAGAGESVAVMTATAVGLR